MVVLNQLVGMEDMVLLLNLVVTDNPAMVLLPHHHPPNINPHQVGQVVTQGKLVATLDNSHSRATSLHLRVKLLDTQDKEPILDKARLHHLHSPDMVPRLQVASQGTVLLLPVVNPHMVRQPRADNLVMVLNPLVHLLLTILHNHQLMP